MPTQYIDTLIQQNAALVHCSSETTLVGGLNTLTLSPLEKIQRAILGDSVIACSTIKSGDTMLCQHTGQILNYTGPLGIIISPKINCSITHANPTDSGSTPVSREETRTNNQVCTVSDFENAIINRVNYNEIFVHTYKVIGIFIKPPITFNMGSYQASFTDKEIYSAFPEYDCYLLNYGNFTRLIFDKTHQSFVQTKKYSISELYS
jgi:hypothetical protein